MKISDNQKRGHPSIFVISTLIFSQNALDLLILRQWLEIRIRIPSLRG